jgi:hypothetical protein
MEVAPPRIDVRQEWAHAACFNAGKLLPDSGHLQEEARNANRKGFSAFNARKWLRFLL